MLLWHLTLLREASRLFPITWQAPHDLHLHLSLSHQTTHASQATAASGTDLTVCTFVPLNCLSLYLKCPLSLCPAGELLLILQNPTQPLPSRWKCSRVPLCHHHIWNISPSRPLLLHATAIVHRSISLIEWALLKGRALAHSHCFPGPRTAPVVS